MQCQNELCREHVMELFPGKLEGEREVKQLCRGCAPKCEFDGVCREPIDIRCEFLCTAHEIAVCEWAERRCDDPKDAEEYRQTIAEFQGRTEMRLAA